MPLHYAADQGHVEVAEKLLAAGAAVGATTNVRAPLAGEGVAGGIFVSIFVSSGSIGWAGRWNLFGRKFHLLRGTTEDGPDQPRCIVFNYPCQLLATVCHFSQPPQDPPDGNAQGSP